MKRIKRRRIYLRAEKLTRHSIPSFTAQKNRMTGQTQRYGRRQIRHLVLLLEWIKLRLPASPQSRILREENSFRQLRLNQWVKQAVRWMPMDRWDKCSFAINEDDLLGRVCYGGLDLSSTTDITAFVLVFPPLDETDKYIILPYFWIPEERWNCV